MADSESSFDLEAEGGADAAAADEEAYDDAAFAADTAVGADDDEDEDFADLVDEVRHCHAAAAHRRAGASLVVAGTGADPDTAVPPHPPLARTRTSPRSRPPRRPRRLPRPRARRRRRGRPQSRQNARRRRRRLPRRLPQPRRPLPPPRPRPLRQARPRLRPRPRSRRRRVRGQSSMCHSVASCLTPHPPPCRAPADKFVLGYMQRVRAAWAAPRLGAWVPGTGLTISFCRCSKTGPTARSTCSTTCTSA